MMHNAIQWFFLGIGALGVILPALIVGISRPWRRMGIEWRWPLWGLAGATAAVFGSAMFAAILASAGELRGARAEYLNTALTAMGPLPGIIVFALIVIATAAACLAVERARRTPAVMDAASVRALARRGIPGAELRAAYVPRPDFSDAEFVTSLARGQADREAAILRARVIAYAPRLRGAADTRQAASLESQVKAAPDLETADRGLAELRLLARRVESHVGGIR